MEDEVCIVCGATEPQDSEDWLDNSCGCFGKCVHDRMPAGPYCSQDCFDEKVTEIVSSEADRLSDDARGH